MGDFKIASADTAGGTVVVGTVVVGTVTHGSSVVNKVASVFELRPVSDLGLSNMNVAPYKMEHGGCLEMIRMSEMVPERKR